MRNSPHDRDLRARWTATGPRAAAFRRRDELGRGQPVRALGGLWRGHHVVLGDGAGKRRDAGRWPRRPWGDHDRAIARGVPAVWWTSSSRAINCPTAASPLIPPWRMRARRPPTRHSTPRSRAPATALMARLRPPAMRMGSLKDRSRARRQRPRRPMSTLQSSSGCSSRRCCVCAGAFLIASASWRWM